MSNIFDRVSITDGSFVDKNAECKSGISLKDMFGGYYNKAYGSEKAKKIHDSNFAFVMTELAKLHTQTYEPEYNITYTQDIPLNMGGGLVDFVSYMTTEWAGMPTQQQNLTGNNVNTIPRVQAKLNQKAVKVFNFEIAYDIKFIEIDKLNKLDFHKSIEAIYKDAVVAGWDMFVDRLAYEGISGANNGFFNHSNVYTTVIPQGTEDITAAGFAAMSDQEIVSVINGILSYYLVNTNNNLALLPDKILLPMTDSSELSQRFSTLYTNTLRRFLMEYNVGKDEAEAAGLTTYKLAIQGRSRLNGAGSLNGGRIVAYKFNEKYVRMDIPYPVQVYITLPNIDRMAYTTAFVGQASEIQLPYNTSSSDIGPVTYWDFTPASSVVKFDKNGGTGSMADFIRQVGSTQTLPSNTFTFSGKTFAGWGLTPTAATADYTDAASIVMPQGTTTLYALWS